LKEVRGIAGLKPLIGLEHGGFWVEILVAVPVE